MQSLMNLTTKPHYRIPSQPQTQPHAYRQPGPYEPPDEETRQTAKLYFKLIQATHHMEVVEKALKNQAFPTGMMRQVHRVTNFIKPSSPTDSTTIKLSQNTHQWMQNNMYILQTHYQSVTHTIKQQINTPNTLALTIAIGWAHKRYKHKLTPTTITRVETILELPQASSSPQLTTIRTNTTRDQPHTLPAIEHTPLQISPPTIPIPTPVPPLSSTEEFPPLSKPRPLPKRQPSYLRTLSLGKQPTLSETYNLRIQTLSKTHLHSLPSTSTFTDSSLSNQKGEVRIATPTTEKEKWKSPVGPPTPKAATPIIAQVHHTVNSQTETSTPTVTPTKQNTNSKRVQGNVSILLRDIITSAPLSPIGGARQGVQTRKGQFKGSMMMIKGQDNGQHPKAPKSEPPQTTNIVVPLPVQDPCTTGASKYPPSSPPQPHLQPQPQPKPTHPPQKPFYHKARPNYKVTDWNIEGHTPTLIIGDSNLNRIPPFNNPNIQVDSYPGATFYHFTKVLEKTPIHTDTATVVISVGLNNKDHDPFQTSLKQLSGMHKEAKKTFPNATIYIPVISHSPLLTSQQKRNLKLINAYITTNFPTLLEIPQDTFHTTTDLIHWTSTTADLIFQHWCRQLNVQLNLH
ncbi:leucine-rich repeat extensin-like protein 5 isoform X2 [Salmo trutta]|uniref:leucine-rich repeat extensin-like protein 5 isoform X1 n=1 Tax=Salmo trutta TaxID=8032 RepID=UPI00113252A6|nr:leucine-rich repeat extensin-like protein 5 isoform X1 [Salmo trutta]XP_029629934.1 leucine-rich repeat extensin-like protein 5 isoform X2 [Salmo trutta]